MSRYTDIDHAIRKVICAADQVEARMENMPLTGPFYMLVREIKHLKSCQRALIDLVESTINKERESES